MRITVGRLIVGTPSTPPLIDAAILVRDSRIAAVGGSRETHGSSTDLEYSFPLGTALPGLIDSHVHLTFSGGPQPLDQLAAETDEQLVERALVNAQKLLQSGVTSALDCGARGTTATTIRRSLKVGDGPRLLVTGRPLTPPRGHCHFLGGGCEGQSGARRAIRRLADEGVDAIKIMATGGTMTAGTDPALPSFDRETLRAAVEESHRQGLRVTAHAHGVEGIRDAVEAGCNSVEHATMINGRRDWTWDGDVAARMSDHGVRVVPALGSGSHPSRFNNSKHLRQAGVELVAGTDAGVANTDFATSIATELASMVRVGLTPLEAIQSATWAAARHLWAAPDRGTLEVGKAADILVVSGDPDRDIAAIARPRLIVQDGVVVTSGT